MIGTQSFVVTQYVVVDGIEEVTMVINNKSDLYLENGMTFVSVYEDVAKSVALGFYFPT